MRVRRCLRQPASRKTGCGASMRPARQARLGPGVGGGGSREADVTPGAQCFRTDDAAVQVIPPGGSLDRASGALAAFSCHQGLCLAADASRNRSRVAANLDATCNASARATAAAFSIRRLPAVDPDPVLVDTCCLSTFKQHEIGRRQMPWT